MSFLKTLRGFWREAQRVEKTVFVIGAMVLPFWLGHEYSKSQGAPLPPLFHDVTRDKNSSPIRVHIAGAVKSPRLLVLPQGSRLNDALRRVGGLTSQADVSALNLAERLSDGQRVIIPERHRRSLRVLEKQNVPPSHQTSQKSFPININTATAQELESLPGVGPATATHIVEERQRQPFRSLQDIDRVKGIGPKKLQQIAPHITF